MIGGLGIAMFLGGCATVRNAPDTTTAKGVVYASIPVAKTNRYWNRSYAQGMGGAFGLLLVDTLIEDPAHFEYHVMLNGGKRIYVRNRAEIPVGTCVSLWLQPDPSSPADHFALKFNDIEASTGCEANLQQALSGSPR
jgi:uncharacterized protein YceK